MSREGFAERVTFEEGPWEGVGHAGRRTFRADSEEGADPREPGAARSQVAAVGWEWGYGGREEGREVRRQGRTDT